MATHLEAQFPELEGLIPEDEPAAEAAEPEEDDQ